MGVRDSKRRKKMMQQQDAALASQQQEEEELEVRMTYFLNENVLSLTIILFDSYTNFSFFLV